MANTSPSPSRVEFGRIGKDQVWKPVGNGYWNGWASDEAHLALPPENLSRYICNPFAHMKRQLLLAGLASGLMLLLPSSADSATPSGELNAEFRPAIVRLELDREKVSAGKGLQIRMDWRANVTTRREYQTLLGFDRHWAASGFQHKHGAPPSHQPVGRRRVDAPRGFQHHHSRPSLARLAAHAFQPDRPRRTRSAHSTR